HAAGEFTSPPFKSGDLKEERIAFTEKWKPKNLWDLNTPQNMCDLNLSLQEGGKPLDTALPVHFGYREFYIDGRDFRLNGSRIFLFCVPFKNAESGAVKAAYAAARESLLRLKSIGVNCVYCDNYDCLPGAHLSFAEILRAADDVGMLFALTQPHFNSNYDWGAKDADQKNGYAAH